MWRWSPGQDSLQDRNEASSDHCSDDTVPNFLGDQNGRRRQIDSMPYVDFVEVHDMPKCAVHFHPFRVGVRVVLKSWGKGGTESPSLEGPPKGNYGQPKHVTSPR